MEDETYFIQLYTSKVLMGTEEPCFFFYLSVFLHHGVWGKRFTYRVWLNAAIGFDQGLK